MLFYPSVCVTHVNHLRRIVQTCLNFSRWIFWRVNGLFFCLLWFRLAEHPCEISWFLLLCYVWFIVVSAGEAFMRIYSIVSYKFFPLNNFACLNNGPFLFLFIVVKHSCERLHGSVVLETFPDESFRMFTVNGLFLFLFIVVNAG